MPYWPAPIAIGSGITPLATGEPAGAGAGAFIPGLGMGRMFGAAIMFVPG